MAIKTMIMLFLAINTSFMVYLAILSKFVFNLNTRNQNQALQPLQFLTKYFNLASNQSSKMVINQNDH